MEVREGHQGFSVLSTAHLPGPIDGTGSVQLQSSGFIQWLTHSVLLCPKDYCSASSYSWYKINVVSSRLLHKEWTCSIKPSLFWRKLLWFLLDLQWGGLSIIFSCLLWPSAHAWCTHTKYGDEGGKNHQSYYATNNKEKQSKAAFPPPSSMISLNWALTTQMCQTPPMCGPSMSEGLKNLQSQERKSWKYEKRLTFNRGSDRPEQKQLPFTPLS